MLWDRLHPTGHIHPNDNGSLKTRGLHGRAAMGSASQSTILPSSHCLPPQPSLGFFPGPWLHQRHTPTKAIPLLVILAQARLAGGSQFVIVHQTSWMPLALSTNHTQPVCTLLWLTWGTNPNSAGMHQMMQRKHIYNLGSMELPSQFKETNLCECGPVTPPLAGSASRIPVLQLLKEDACAGSRLSQPMLDRR